MGRELDIKRPNDPLFQPYQLKHLTLKNRIMITSHEPGYAEDGMPKDRYRAYHVERAKAGIAMTMTAGSASVSLDSPPAFNNLLVYKDEVVPWLKTMSDEIPERESQSVVKNEDGDFQLFRIGDAVSGRNIHAAIYDALRLMRTI